MEIEEKVFNTQTPFMEPLKSHNLMCQTLYHNMENVRANMDERKLEIQKVERAILQPDQALAQELQLYFKTLEDQMTAMNQDYASSRQHLLVQIDATLSTAASAKDHLLNHDLKFWKVHQKLAQFSPKAEQEKLAKELDRLDTIFEECGEEFRKLRNSAELLEQDMVQQLGDNVSQDLNYPKLLDLKNSINIMIYQFMWESCVVARQPPCVLMKARAPQGADGHRRQTVRPPCQPVLRLLGGASLGLRVASQEEVTCYIIGEEQARNLGTPGYEVKPIGHILHNKARFELDDEKRYFASFNRPMALTDISRPPEGNEAIPRLRYYLLFLVKLCGAAKLKGGPQMVLQGGKLSLPLAALVHPRQEYEQGGDAFIFWDLAFSEGEGILTKVPRENHSGIPWPKAKDALNRKFQQLVEGAKPESQLRVPLSEIAMNHLAEKFFKRLPNNCQDYSNFKLTWANFFKKENGTGYTFREWFYKAAEIVNRKLFKHWNDNLIVGFASRHHVEQILRQQNRPTMVIKFSDMNLGCLIISYYKPGSEMGPQHLQLAANDLDVVPLVNCVRQCPELQDVSWIYPNHPISELWKNEEAKEESGAQAGGAFDPYARRMYIGMKVENPIIHSWTAPDPPPNLDLDTIYDWLAEQDMPGTQVIQGKDLEANHTDIQINMDFTVL